MKFSGQAVIADGRSGKDSYHTGEFQTQVDKDNRQEQEEEKHRKQFGKTTILTVYDFSSTRIRETTAFSKTPQS